MTNHSGCTVRAIRCTTRRSNISLRVNGKFVRKALFLQQNFVAATSRTNSVWSGCSNKILLLRQRFSQKFFSTHVRFVAAMCRSNLLPSVYRPSNSTLETLRFPRDCCIIFCEEIKQGNVWKVARKCLSWTALNFYVYAWPFIQVREDKFCQYWVLCARELASFWRENVTAVLFLLRVLARISKWQKQING